MFDGNRRQTRTHCKWTGRGWRPSESLVRRVFQLLKARYWRYRWLMTLKTPCTWRIEEHIPMSCRREARQTKTRLARGREEQGCREGNCWSMSD
jgi:hypothetical protein